MRELLALASIGLGFYLIVTDDRGKRWWLPWALLFIVPILVLQA